MKMKSFTTLLESAMPSTRVAEMMNEQVFAEMEAGILYLACSSWFSDAGLDGFAAWSQKQASEEFDHSMKWFTFLREANTVPFIKGVKAPPSFLFEDIDEAMMAMLNHEEIVSEKIKSILRAAREESDFAVEKFLLGFLDEQVEEENKVREILNKLEIANDNEAAILEIDGDLAG